MSPTPPTAALPTAPDAPDAEFARALGLAPEALAATAPPLGPEEEAARVSVLEHYAAMRPGPSSFPAIATQILELVRYPDVDLKQLTSYIRLDGALAASILALANSAIYRAVRHIDSLKDAVARLGLGEVARLAAAVSMRTLYQPEVLGEFQRHAPTWERLFLHGIRTARAASELARRKLAPTPGAEQAFLAGLLHDVGMSIAMRSYAAREQAKKIAPLDQAALDRVLHAVHVEVGVDLHRTWNLPPALLEVVAHHHAAAVPAVGEAGLVHLVRLASAVDLLRTAPASSPRAAAEVLGSARALKLSPAKVADLVQELEAAEGWAATAFASAKA
jgi:putative nucleotidyltransferase with HDIG domain